MTTTRLDTDYLVVGCGAAGMAFTDSLIAASDADVVMVDRRHAPGGHWLDAYPFVRLHQPSAYYGVNSTPLGSDRIDVNGPNAGMYEQASASEICAYYDEVMHRTLLPSGRARYLPMCDHRPDGRVVSRVSGAQYDVHVRSAVVDAKYLQAAVPATYAAPFEVGPGVRCVPVGDLTRPMDDVERYVVIGAGKTAIDACLWLLGLGVDPDRILWVKSRETWLRNRAFAQGGDLVGSLLEGLALQLRVAKDATSIPELFAALERAEVLLRVDRDVKPTMYKAATMSVTERDELRRIRAVVRMGHVRRIDTAEIVLAGGSVAARRGDLYVHCTAPGLNPAPSVPIFSERRITLQPVRTGLIPFNAAMVGFVEASGRELPEKNRLCPPNRLPDTPRDWIRGTLADAAADRAWSREPDISVWLQDARLNTANGLRNHLDEPRVQAAMAELVAAVRPGVASLASLLSTGPAPT